MLSKTVGVVSTRCPRCRSVVIFEICDPANRPDRQSILVDEYKPTYNPADSLDGLNGGAEARL
jgi:hypothetical protein